MILRFRAAVAAFALAVSVPAAQAVDLSAQFPYNFRDNSFGLLAGQPARDIIVFGAFVVTPNSLAGTTGTYSQLNTISGTPVAGALPGTPYTANPNVFETIVPYSEGLKGSWQFEFTNGSQTASLATGPLGTVGSMPLAENVQIIGNGATPTVTWSVPAMPQDVRHDKTQIFVFERLSDTTFDILHLGPYLDPTTTSAVVPANLIADPFLATVPELSIQPGKTYVVAVNFVQLDDAGNPSTRSLHGVDYTMQPIPEPSTIALLFAGLGAVGFAASRRRRSA